MWNDFEAHKLEFCRDKFQFRFMTAINAIVEEPARINF